jgi:nucleoside-diphosphate-sugar epimerase
MKKILIIGGAGYIGTKFCHKFCDEYKITVVDPIWFENQLPKKVKLIKKDAIYINNFFLNKNKFYAAIILGGLSNDPMANINPLLNYDHNLKLTAYLLDLFKNSKIKKIIFGSSCSVYGFSKKVMNEKNPIKVEYPYGISKYLSDKMIELINSHRINNKFYSLRQGTVCGGSPRMRFDLVINKMVRDAIFNNKITVNKNKIWRPILDINDAVEIYRIFINKNIKSGIYNVFSYNILINELAKKIKKFIDNKLNKNVKIIHINSKEKRSYKVSRAKLNKEIQNKYKNLFFTVSNIYKCCMEIGEPFNKKYENIFLFKKFFKIK